jgi:hypothetical protein
VEPAISRSGGECPLAPSGQSPVPGQGLPTDSSAGINQAQAIARLRRRAIEIMHGRLPDSYGLTRCRMLTGYGRSKRDCSTTHIDMYVAGPIRSLRVGPSARTAFSRTRLN